MENEIKTFRELKLQMEQAAGQKYSIFTKISDLENQCAKILSTVKKIENRLLQLKQEEK